MSRYLLKALLLAGMLLAFSLPRLVELDRYVTPDEPKWLMRSANFYMALSQRSYKDTYQHEQPGVTTTMAGMLGFLRRYPHYVDVRPGQIERPEKLVIFLRNREISPLRLLEAGRTVMVLVNTLVFGLTFLAAWSALGALPAIIGGTLIAFDPFFIALTRLLHVDGLMSGLVLLSLLSAIGYFYKGRQRGCLLLSGVAAGLSWLTKSPAFFLAPFLGLVALVDYLANRSQEGSKGGAPAQNSTWLRGLWQALAPVVLWFAIGAAVFTLLWPAMWIDPLGSLGKVFSQARLYAIEGHESPTFFNGQVFPAGDSAWYFYPISYVWRASPPVLIGLGLGLAVLLFPRRLGLTGDRMRAILVLGSFAVLFGVFMSFGDKKFDRYLLPSHVVLDMVAALGWIIAIQAVQVRLEGRLRSGILRWGAAAAYTLIIAIQLSGAVSTSPYYFDYYNPMLGGSQKALEVMMVGWGEGLDQAAGYLNRQPDSEQLVAVAWFGDGPFSFIFNGQTISMDVDQTLEDVKKADYAVLYLNQWQRLLPNPQVLEYFAGLEPDYVARIGDLEYVRVYKIR